MKKLVPILMLFLLIAMGAYLAAAQSETAVIAGEEPVELELVLADFEAGVPLTQDEFGNGLGFVPWGDVVENVTLSARQLVPFSTLALPNTHETANTVLAVNYDITGWGGFTHALNDGENWIAMDWTDYNALSFWLYGANTGGVVQVDLFDNRNPEFDGDTAERFYYRLADDYVGWRQWVIPFALFQRRTDFQPNGALNDGLGLNEVAGYAFGFPVGAGAQTAYIDRVGLTTVEDTTAATQVSAVDPATQATEIDTSIGWDTREWELLWADEFEGAAETPVNTEYWTAETGGSGWGNNELEYYTDRVENLSLDGNGNLAIVARQENPNNYRCHYGKCSHTSARIITKDKITFTYGRVEARIKVPRGQGIWPAFWMLGNDISKVGWPNSGEIDIMEHIGKKPRNVYGTVHGPNYSGANGIQGAYEIDADLADDFHVFAVDWDPDVIRWYVDGNLYSTFTPDKLNGRKWVFDKDFFIILNVAVGGNWPGIPDETTEFPQTMLVDYVRVYQLADSE
jgi:beta-glucanase (GH16 family)